MQPARGKRCRSVGGTAGGRIRGWAPNEEVGFVKARRDRVRSHLEGADLIWRERVDEGRAPGVAGASVAALADREQRERLELRRLQHGGVDVHVRRADGGRRTGARRGSWQRRGWEGRRRRERPRGARHWRGGRRRRGREPAYEGRAPREWVGPHRARLEVAHAVIDDETRALGGRGAGLAAVVGLRSHHRSQNRPIRQLRILLWPDEQIASGRRRRARRQRWARWRRWHRQRQSRRHGRPRWLGRWIRW